MAAGNNITPLTVVNVSSIEEDDDSAISHSPRVPRYEPALYKYNREEMISVFVDDGYPLPELLPTYKSLFVDRIQQPLSLMPNLEENINLDNTANPPSSPSPDPYIHGDETGYFMNSTPQKNSFLNTKTDVTYASTNNVENLRQNCSIDEELSAKDHQEHYVLKYNSNLDDSNDGDDDKTTIIEHKREKSKLKSDTDNIRTKVVVDGDIMLPHTFYTHSPPNIVNNNGNNVLGDNINSRHFTKSKDKLDPTPNTSSVMNHTNNTWCRKNSLSLGEVPIMSIRNRYGSSVNNMNGIGRGRCANNRNIDDHNLPEWALETPLALGGTFDAAGEFHGLIHDNTPSMVQTTQKDVVATSRHYDFRPLFNKNDIEDNFNISYVGQVPNHPKDDKDYREKFFPLLRNSVKRIDDQITVTGNAMLNSYNGNFAKIDEFPYNLSDITANAPDKIGIVSDMSAIKLMNNLTPAHDPRNVMNPAQMLGSNIDSNSRSSSSGSSTLFSEERASGNNKMYRQQQQFIDSLTEQRLQYQNLPQPLAQNTAHNMWFYRDPQSKVQGPFSSLEMLEWCKAGYFSEGLLVRRICDILFRPLGEMIKLCGGQMPFLYSHLIPINRPNNMNTPINIQNMVSITPGDVMLNNSRDSMVNQKLQTHHNALMQMLEVKNSNLMANENSCNGVAGIGGLLPTNNCNISNFLKKEKFENETQTAAILMDLRNKPPHLIPNSMNALGNYMQATINRPQMNEKFILEQSKDSPNVYLKQFIEHGMNIERSEMSLPQQSITTMIPSQIDNCLHNKNENLDNVETISDSVNESNLDFLNGMNLRKFLKSANGANLYDFIMESKALGVSPDVISSYVMKILKSRVSATAAVTSSLSSSASSSTSTSSQYNYNGLNINDQSNRLLEQFQNIILQSRTTALPNKQIPNEINNIKDASMNDNEILDNEYPYPQTTVLHQEDNKTTNMCTILNDSSIDVKITENVENFHDNVSPSDKLQQQQLLQNCKKQEKIIQKQQAHQPRTSPTFGKNEKATINTADSQSLRAKKGGTKIKVEDSSKKHLKMEPPKDILVETVIENGDSAFKTFNNHMNNVTYNTSVNNRESLTTGTTSSLRTSSDNHVKDTHNQNYEQEFYKVVSRQKNIKRQKNNESKDKNQSEQIDAIEKQQCSSDNIITTQAAVHQKDKVPDRNDITDVANLSSNTILDYLNNAMKQRDKELLGKTKQDNSTNAPPWYVTANVPSSPCLAEIQRAERKQQRAQKRQTKSKLKEDSSKMSSLIKGSESTKTSTTSDVVSGTVKWNTTSIPVKSLDEIQAEEARNLTNLNTKHDYNNQEQKHDLATAIRNNKNTNDKVCGKVSVTGFWDDILNQKNTAATKNAKQNIPDTLLNVKMHEDGNKHLAKKGTTAIKTGSNSNNNNIGGKTIGTTTSAAIAIAQQQKQLSQANQKISRNDGGSLQNKHPLATKNVETTTISSTQQDTKNKSKNKSSANLKNAKPDDYEAEFSNWCKMTLTSMNTKLDVPTFITFLRDLESPYEVKEYIRAYIGGGKQCLNFAKEYLERRSMFKSRQRALNAHNDDLCKPAVAITPNGKDCCIETKVKEKRSKKTKMTTKLDSNLLGYRTERRSNGKQL